MPSNDYDTIAAIAGRFRFTATGRHDPVHPEPRTSGAGSLESFAAVLEAVRPQAGDRPAGPALGHGGAVAGGLLATATVEALGRVAASLSPPDPGPARLATPPGGGAGGVGGLVWPGPNPGAGVSRQSVGAGAGRRSASDTAGTDAAEPQVAVPGGADDEPPAV